MSEHTPGPWTRIDRVVVTTWQTHDVATWLANCAVGGMDVATQEANARLMASAPEMLEALRIAVMALAHASTHYNAKAYSDAYGFVSATIDKATKP